MMGTVTRRGGEGSRTLIKVSRGGNAHAKGKLGGWPDATAEGRTVVV